MKRLFVDTCSFLGIQTSFLLRLATSQKTRIMSTDKSLYLFNLIIIETTSLKNLGNIILISIKYLQDLNNYFLSKITLLLDPKIVQSI